MINLGRLIQLFVWVHMGLFKHVVWLCLFVFCSMAVFICAYEFVFMHVCVHACAYVCLCMCVTASYGPSGLCVCHLERQVSMCPRTPLFLVLQRPWTACVCVCLCVQPCRKRQTQPLWNSLWTLCVRGVVCVYVCVLTNDQPGFFENYSLEEVETEVLVCAKV